MEKMRIIKHRHGDTETRRHGENVISFRPRVPASPRHSLPIRILSVLISGSIVITMPGTTAWAKVTSDKDPRNAYRSPLAAESNGNRAEMAQANLPVIQNLSQLEYAILNNSPSQLFAAAAAPGTLRDVTADLSLPMNVTGAQSQNILNKLRDSVSGGDSARSAVDAVMVGKVPGVDFSDLDVVPRINAMIQTVDRFAQQDLGNVQQAYVDFYTAMLSSDSLLQALAAETQKLVQDIRDVEMQIIQAQQELNKARSLPAYASALAIKEAQQKIEKLNQQLNTVPKTLSDGTEVPGLKNALQHMQKVLIPKVRAAKQDNEQSVAILERALNTLKGKYGGWLSFTEISRLEAEARASLSVGLKPKSIVPANPEEVSSKLLFIMEFTAVNSLNPVMIAGALAGEGVKKAMGSGRVEAFQKARTRNEMVEAEYKASMLRRGTGTAELKRLFDLAQKVARARSLETLRNLQGVDKFIDGLQITRQTLFAQMREVNDVLEDFTKLANKTLSLDSPALSATARAWVKAYGMSNVNVAANEFASAAYRQAYRTFDSQKLVNENGFPDISRNPHLARMDFYDNWVGETQQAASRALERTVLDSMTGSQGARDTLNALGTRYLDEDGKQFASIPAWRAANDPTLLNDSRLNFQGAQTMAEFSQTLAHDLGVMGSRLTPGENLTLVVNDTSRSFVKSVGQVRVDFMEDPIGTSLNVASYAGGAALATVAMGYAAPAAVPYLMWGGGTLAATGVVGSGALEAATAPSTVSRTDAFMAGSFRAVASATSGALTVGAFETVGLARKVVSNLSAEAVGLSKGLRSLSLFGGDVATAGRAGAGLAMRAASSPARVVAELAKPFIPASLGVYGIETGASGTLTAEGTFNALTAPVRTVWGNVQEGAYGQEDYRPAQLGIATVVHDVVSTGVHALASVGASVGLIDSSRVNSITQAVTSVVGWGVKGQAIGSDVVAFGVGGKMVGKGASQLLAGAQTTAARTSVALGRTTSVQVLDSYAATRMAVSGANLAEAGFSAATVRQANTFAAVGKHASTVAMNVPMKAFFEDQIHNGSKVVSAVLRHGIFSQQSLSEFGHFASGVAQMAFGVGAAGGGFAEGALKEHGYSTQNAAARAAPRTFGWEVAKLTTIAAVGQIVPDLAIAGGILAPVLKAPLVKLTAPIGEKYLGGYREARAARDAERVVDRYTPEAILKTATAPRVGTEAFSDLQVYAGDPRVVQAAAARLSGNEAGQKLLGDLAAGVPNVSAGGVSTPVPILVRQAANNALFNATAGELGAPQLATLQSGQNVTHNGSVINGSLVDPQAIARQILISANPTESSRHAAVLELSGRSQGRAVEGIAPEAIAQARAAQLQGLNGEVDAKVGQVLGSRAEAARRSGQEGLANHLEHMAAERNAAVAADILETMKADTATERGALLRAQAEFDSSQRVLLESRARVDSNVTTAQISAALATEQRSRSNADLTTTVEKAKVAVATAQTRVSAAESKSLIEQHAADAELNYARNQLKLAELRENQAAQQVIVEDASRPAAEHLEAQRALEKLQASMDATQPQATPLKTLKDSLQMMVSGSGEEVAAAAARANAAKLELGRLTVKAPTMTARIWTGLNRGTARALVALNLAGAPSLAQMPSYDARTKAVVLDAKPAEFRGSLGDYVRYEQSRRDAANLEGVREAKDQSTASEKDAATQAFIEKRIAELERDSQQLKGLTAGDLAELNLLKQQSRAIIDGNSQVVEDVASLNERIDSVRQSAMTDAFSEGKGNVLITDYAGELARAHYMAESARTVVEAQQTRSEALLNAARTRAEAGKSSLFGRLGLNREAKGFDLAAETARRTINDIQTKIVKDYYDTLTEATHQRFNVLEQALHETVSSKKTLSPDLAAALKELGLSSEPAEALKEFKDVRKARMNALKATREASIAAVEYKQALDRGDIEAASKLAQRFMLAGGNEAAQARARQFRQEIQNGLPGHQAISFEGLREGKGYLEAGNAEEFQKWLKKASTAMTEDGFHKTWQHLFGSKSVAEARALLAERLGGQDPTTYVQDRQNTVDAALAKAGLNGKAFKDLANREADGAKVKAVLDEILANAKGADKVVLGRLFAARVLEGVFNGGSLRVGQNVALNLFAEGLNAIVDAGGGKTEVFMIDQMIHSVLNRGLYRGEILVESAAAANKYVNRDSVVALAKAFGMELVDGTALQRNHDTAGLIEAFTNKNKLVILDPETRGHLLNEAFSNVDLRKAMQESNIIGFDEVHFAATNRTSAIVGSDMRAPDALRIERITGLYHEVNSLVLKGPQGLKSIGEGNFYEARSKSEFNDLQKMLNADGAMGVIRFKGEFFASNALLSRLDLRSYTSGEIRSVLWASTTAKDSPNGYAVIADANGRKLIYPVNAFGKTEFNQISHDVNAQIAIAVKHGQDARTTVRVQRTSISTSLGALFENAYARKVGGSATLKGLDALLQSRIGSRSVNVSGSDLQLSYLLNENGRSGVDGLHQGEIRIDAQDLNKPEHFDAFVEEVRAQLKDTNVVIATEDPALIQKLAKALNVSEEQIINGNIADSKVNDIAAPVSVKDLGLPEGTDLKDPEVVKNLQLTSEQRLKIEKLIKGNIIIINPRAYTGADFQQNAAAYVLGGEKLGEQDLVQVLKRLNRPIADTGLRNLVNKVIQENWEALGRPAGEAPLLGERWQATRNLRVTSEADLQASLKFAEEKIATGEIVEVFEFQNNQRALDLVRQATVDGVLDTSRLSLTDRIELNAFANQAYVNSEAAKFAIQDALREEYVIKPLKDALSAMPKNSKEYRAVQRVLDEVLNGNSGDYAPLKAEDYAKTLTSKDYISNTLTQVSVEARNILRQVESSMGRRADPALRRWVDAQRGEIMDLDAAATRYEQLKSRSDLSFASAKTAVDRLGVVKYAQNLILSGETSVQAADVRSAQAGESAWRTVQEALREVQPSGKTGLRLTMHSPSGVSAPAARQVAAALQNIDLSTLPLGSYRRNILSDLMTAKSLSELQDKLTLLGMSANTGRGGVALTPPSRQSKPETGVSYMSGWTAQVFSNSQSAVQQRAFNLTQILVQPFGASVSSEVEKAQANALELLKQMADQRHARSAVAAAAEYAIGQARMGATNKELQISDEHQEALRDLKTLAEDPLVNVKTEAMVIERRQDGSVDVTVRDISDARAAMWVSLAIDQAAAGRRIRITLPESGSSTGLQTSKDLPGRVIAAARQVNDNGGHLSIQTGSGATHLIRTGSFEVVKTAMAPLKRSWRIGSSQAVTALPGLKIAAFRSATDALGKLKPNQDATALKKQVSAAAADLIHNAKALRRALDRGLLSVDAQSAQLIRDLASAADASGVMKALRGYNRLDPETLANLARTYLNEDKPIVESEYRRGEQSVYLSVAAPSKSLNAVQAFFAGYYGTMPTHFEKGMQDLLNGTQQMSFDESMVALTKALKPMIPTPGKKFSGDQRLAHDILRTLSETFEKQGKMYVVKPEIVAQAALIDALEGEQAAEGQLLVLVAPDGQADILAKGLERLRRTENPLVPRSVAIVERKPYERFAGAVRDVSDRFESTHEQRLPEILRYTPSFKEAHPALVQNMTTVGMALFGLTAAKLALPLLFINIVSIVGYMAIFKFINIPTSGFYVQKQTSIQRLLGFVPLMTVGLLMPTQLVASLLHFTLPESLGVAAQSMGAVAAVGTLAIARLRYGRQYAHASSIPFAPPALTPVGGASFIHNAPSGLQRLARHPLSRAMLIVPPILLIALSGLVESAPVGAVVHVMSSAAPLVVTSAFMVGSLLALTSFFTKDSESAAKAAFRRALSVTA